MSFRNIPISEQEMRDFIRRTSQRLNDLESGGAIRGQVSFGPVIQIGDVLISILNGSGTQRIVQFKNVLSGATYTITL